MSKLYSPLRIGQLELAHRLVTTVRSEARLTVTQYRRRTTPGGLVIADGCPQRDSDSDRWARVTNAIHEANGLAVALLSPRSEREHIDDVDIDAVMDDIQCAARLAKAAGFDGVELDAADASLPDRFLAPETNSRRDDYGGSADRRMRFMLEGASVIAEEYSSERVGVRLSPCARMGQLDLFAGVMRAVSEYELAYIHLAAPSGPPATPLSLAARADRQAFRTDISCALIVSEDCDVLLAATVVDSRWADAIGFLQTNEDPDFIARSLGSPRVYQVADLDRHARR